jgi:hypothetical protein
MSATNFHNLSLQSKSKLLRLAGAQLQDLSPFSGLHDLSPGSNVSFPDSDELDWVHFESQTCRSQDKLLKLAGMKRKDLSPGPQVHGRLCHLRQKAAGFAIGRLGWKRCAKYLRE